MRRIRFLLRVALGMSKVESNGLVIFLPLVLLIILLPAAINRMCQPPAVFDQESERVSGLTARIGAAAEETPTGQEVVPAMLRSFNPNLVSADELKLMGVSDKAADNWQKYLNSGGRFERASDIRKIYGLKDNVYHTLQPYIKIATKLNLSGSRQYEQKSENPEMAGYRVETERNRVGKQSLTAKEAFIHPFDLNNADTIELQQIRGIGPVFSKRIVKYREILGGFVDKAQLNEVYGLNDEVLAQLDTLVFIGEAYTIRPLYINEASDEDLSGHPYLSAQVARAITSYRQQHGFFTGPGDLYNIHLLDSLTIARISPYLEF